MSLSINSNYSQPSFGSNKFLTQAGNFARAQAQHLFYKSGFPVGVAITAPNLKQAIAGWIFFDGLEGLYKALKNQDLTIKHQCTNIFAYISDGVKGLKEARAKKYLL